MKVKSNTGTKKTTKRKHSGMKGGNQSQTVNCPPGAFCIENYTMFFIITVLGISLYLFNNLRLYTNNFNWSSPFSNHTHLSSSPHSHAHHHHNNLPPHTHNIASEFAYQNAIQPQSMYDMLRPLADPRVSVSSDPKDTLLNPYAPPVQVNQPHAYRQIGYLKNESMGHQMFPIFAKPQHIRRDKWYYYTIYDNIKLPIYSKGRKCSSEHGCDSLYNGDVVTLENLPGSFVVSTYDNATLVYDPVTV
jgi:hypothetical protein